MILTRQALHVRWFHFVQSKIGDKEKYRNGTNLCHFMRVVFLWGLALVIFVSLVVSIAATVLFVLPFYGQWYGPIGVAVAAAVFGAGYVISRLIGRYGRKLAPVGSLAHCAYEHAKAVKNKFCPLVSFY
jgi:hypothetical protein